MSSLITNSSYNSHWIFDVRELDNWCVRITTLGVHNMIWNLFRSEGYQCPISWPSVRDMYVGMKEGTPYFNGFEWGYEFKYPEPADYSLPLKVIINTMKAEELTEFPERGVCCTKNTTIINFIQGEYGVVDYTSQSDNVTTIAWNELDWHWFWRDLPASKNSSAPSVNEFKLLKYLHKHLGPKKVVVPALPDAIIIPKLGLRELEKEVVNIFTNPGWCYTHSDKDIQWLAHKVTGVRPSYNTWVANRPIICWGLDFVYQKDKKVDSTYLYELLKRIKPEYYEEIAKQIKLRRQALSSERGSDGSTRPITSGGESPSVEKRYARIQEEINTSSCEVRKLIRSGQVGLSPNIRSERTNR